MIKMMIIHTSYLLWEDIYLYLLKYNFQYYMDYPVLISLYKHYCIRICKDSYEIANVIIFNPKLSNNNYLKI